MTPPDSLKASRIASRSASTKAVAGFESAGAFDLDAMRRAFG
jgi:hypothetical protein